MAYSTLQYLLAKNINNSIFSCKVFFLLCIHISLSYTTNSQNYTYENYNVKRGLISSNVYRIIQDSKGFIWIATECGVSKFDGYSFQNFTTRDGLLNNEIIFKRFADFKFNSFNGFCFVVRKMLNYFF